MMFVDEWAFANGTSHGDDFLAQENDGCKEVACERHTVQSHSPPLDRPLSSTIHVQPPPIAASNNPLGNHFSLSLSLVSRGRKKTTLHLTQLLRLNWAAYIEVLNDQNLVHRYFDGLVQCRKRQSQNTQFLSLCAGAVNSQNSPPLLNSVGEGIQHRLRLLPVNAGICDADTVLQTSLTFGRHLLVACIQLAQSTQVMDDLVTYPR